MKQIGRMFHFMSINNKVRDCQSDSSLPQTARNRATQPHPKNSFHLQIFDIVTIELFEKETVQNGRSNS
jgi:hypothetical protein